MLILESAHILQNSLVLKHEDAKFHARRYDAQELLHFVLRLQGRRVFHDLVAHFLLQVELQIQIDHRGVYFREFALKCSVLLVERRENEGELTENIRVNNGSHENAKGSDDRLQAVLRSDVGAEEYEDGRVQ